MGDYALTTSKLCKYYGQNQILENVTMSVPSNSINFQHYYIYSMYRNYSEN